MYLELLWALPFVLLLGSIAIFPLIRKHWWEKNYAYLALGLGLVVILHYLFQLKNTKPLLYTGHEYFSFIVLIGSLFVVSGGIHIGVKGEATPLSNTIFLLIGSVLANILGTTGASMVLIRPWIRMNKYRITAFHIVFFIFLVSNIGGGLTPIGDPPLFLGFLKGVPFFWVIQNVSLEWAIAVALLLVIFYVIDRINFAKEFRSLSSPHGFSGDPKSGTADSRFPPEADPIRCLSEKHSGMTTIEEKWKVSGSRNIFFLLLIIGAVFIEHPLFVREALMILAAVLSLKTTPKTVHEANEFNFAPIIEVAVLFAGIFATMIPALEWLERYAGELGIRTPGQFYWGCGILSSVLDNAPTYLNFLSAIIGLFAHTPAGEAIPAGKDAVQFLLQQHAIYIKAISVSAVYFGAMTYIGNGPNFLVKSIAEQQKIHTPSFFGYIFRYSLPILIPVFALIWYCFFR